MIFNQKFPKIFEEEDSKKISKENLKKFQSYANNFHFVRQFKGANTSSDMTLLISSNVRISYIYFVLSFTV